MAVPYVRATWLDSITPADAAHMNNIEETLHALASDAPANGEIGIWVAAQGKLVYRTLVDADIPASIARDSEVAAIEAALDARLDALEANGMRLIEEKVLVGTNQQLNFTGIPQTYRHLRFIGTVQTNEALTDSHYYLRFNNDATGNYWNQTLVDVGTTVTAGGAGGQAQGTVGTAPGNITPGNLGTMDLLVPNYALSGVRKPWRSNSGSFSYQRSSDGIWVGTDAISTITFFATGGVGFNAPTRVALYGIK